MYLYALLVGSRSSQSLAVKTSIAVAKRSLSPLSLPLYSKYVSNRRQNSVASSLGILKRVPEEVFCPLPC